MWLTCVKHMWSSKITCESQIPYVSHGNIFTCETHVLSMCFTCEVTCEISHVKFHMWKAVTWEISQVIFPCDSSHSSQVTGFLVFNNYCLIILFDRAQNLALSHRYCWRDNTVRAHELQYLSLLHHWTTSNNNLKHTCSIRLTVTDSPPVRACDSVFS